MSILIASWNSRELIQALLTSIEAHPPACPFEVVVVDNGSTDGSADLVERMFPRARLIRNQQNLGYARANNQGWSSAAGEVILLLGSDTQITDDSLQRMLQYLQAHNDVGAVACRLMGFDGAVQRSCHRFPRVIDAVLTYLSLHRLARRYNYAGFDYYGTQPVDQPPGTCLLIRRSVLKAAGLFDERYTILYNDVDLCKRIWDAGWKIIYLGSASVRHHGSYSTRRTPPALRLEMYRNILLYFYRASGIGAVVFLLPILFLRLAVVNKGRHVAGLFSFDYLTR